MTDTTLDNLSSELRFALEVTREAALLARRIQDEMVNSALRKEDRSPVTVADFTIQALVARRLSRTFPATPLVAEESAEALRQSGGEAVAQAVARFVSEFEPDADSSSVRDWIDRGEGETRGRFWVLDPIDGTKGFLRSAQYVVALALVDEGRVELATLGCPRLDLGLARGRARVDPSESGCLLAAARGRGCWIGDLNGGALSPLRVSSVSAPAEAVMVRSVESGHTNLTQLERLTEVLRIRRAPLPVDSQAKYALLASGHGDLLLRLISRTNPDYREKIWDQAPGTLIVEEAGGKVTDLDGRPLDFTRGRKLTHNRGVVASNGHLHAAVLEALKAVEEDDSGRMS
jgi:3'(2'), 5'-bisphosphate nucleotidase